MACRSCHHQGLKPHSFHGSARLKPCPDTNQIITSCSRKCRNSSDRPGGLFECIRPEMTKGSPEGYNAETGSEQPAQKPQTGEPNERQPLYRIRCTQEKRQLLRQAGRRADCRGKQVASDARRTAPVGRETSGAVHGAMEATLFSGWIYDTLKPFAAQLQMGHPALMKAIGASKKKNDKLDARKIADLVRCNLLPACYVAPAEIRELRRMLRYRNLVVVQATRMKNKVS